MLYRGLIVVTGGECNNGKPFVENEAFDVKTGRWSTLAPMPSRTARHPGRDRRTDDLRSRRRAGVPDGHIGHTVDVQIALRRVL